MRKSIALTIVASVSTSLAFAATDWNVLRPQGRPYVTFGNVARFYQFPDYHSVSRTVSLRRERSAIRAQAGTSELSINGVRFFTNFPLLSSGDEALISVMDLSKIIEPVLRPNRIQKFGKIDTIVLDPGHGGSDQGASGRWGSEKDATLAVALEARDQLIHTGYKVEMTRTNDSGVSLEERVIFANRFPNSLFVSIHFNSALAGAGVESYWLAPEGVVSNASSEHHVAAVETERQPGNAQDSQNIALAASIHAAVLSKISAFDRGIRHARFFVLRDIRVPAILLEGGFLTDGFEGPRIATPQYRQQLGGAIALGIKNYDSAVNFPSVGATFAAASSLPAHSHSITEPLGADTAPEGMAPHPPPSVSINVGE